MLSIYLFIFCNQYATLYYTVWLLPACFLKLTMRPLNPDVLSPSISVAVVLLRHFRLGEMYSALSVEKALIHWIVTFQGFRRTLLTFNRHYCSCILNTQHMLGPCWSWHLLIKAVVNGFCKFANLWVWKYLQPHDVDVMTGAESLVFKCQGCCSVEMTRVIIITVLLLFGITMWNLTSAHVFYVLCYYIFMRHCALADASLHH